MITGPYKMIVILCSMIDRAMYPITKRMNGAIETHSRDPGPMDRVR